MYILQAKYPIGHPRIITRGFKAIHEYFGIVKCKILPPRGLFHPILPMSSDGKLKFPLCSTCAEKETEGACECSNEERAMLGTWCTPEVSRAVELGYKVL